MASTLDVPTRHRPVLDPALPSRRAVEPRLPGARARHPRQRRPRDRARPPGRHHLHAPHAHPARRRRRHASSTASTSSGWSSSCSGRRAAARSSWPAAPRWPAWLAAAYAEKGLRAFDRDLVGRRMFGQPIGWRRSGGRLPPARETSQPLGRHLDGCRIGFDLGGSRPQVRGGGRRQGRLLRRGGVEPLLREGPLLPLRRGSTTRCSRAAAHLPRDRRHRRQRGRRLREQRAARGLALPRDRRGRLRPPHPGPVPRRCRAGGAACRSRS